MKKTVSWSTETLQRDREIEEALAATSSKDNTGMSSSSGGASGTSSSSSSSSTPKVTAPQVNSRIQQMIAMQKAQNATMRQLMSTGYGGVGSSSPSGLKDLLVLPTAAAAASGGGINTKETSAPKSIQDSVIVEDANESPIPPRSATLVGSTKFQPIKPPAESKELDTHKPGILAFSSTSNKKTTSSPGGNSSIGSSGSNGGIHYQGHPKTTNIFTIPPPPPIPPPLTHPVVPRSSMSTPPLLHPTLPPEITDSPVSYNSVLDQNATPGAIIERKRMQRQLQTIQSQNQMEGQYSEDVVIIGDHGEGGQGRGGMGIVSNNVPHDSQSLRIEQYTQPNMNQDINWGNMEVTREYSLKPIDPHRHGPVYQQNQPQRRSIAGYGMDMNEISPLEKDVPSSSSPMKHSQYASQVQKSHQQQQRQQKQQHVTDRRTTSPMQYPPSHTQHQFHYGGGSGPPASVSIQSNFNHGGRGGGYGSLANGDDDPRQSLMGKGLHNNNNNNYNANDNTMSFTDEMRHRIHHRRRKLWWTILCYPFRCLVYSEQLGRSFCFGAIDGMLTGAGILSACIGLGLISRLTLDESVYESAMHTRWLIITLTLAACFSDGVCMAIGHVWSTRLVAGATYEERKEELRNFETSRSEAKARLVDALLFRGMLKIDAMSLADTLEGYPDLFVSALLGEGFSGVNAGGGMAMGMGGLGSGGGGSGMVRVLSGGSAGKNRARMPWGQHHQQSMPDEWGIPPASYDAREMTPGGLKYESYSDFSDFHQDQDRKTLAETVSDSRMEGFFMMLSFALFSVVPSLIYTFFPVLANYILANGDVNILSHDRPPSDSLALSLSLGLTIFIMFLLGAWKSHFYSSNWCLFGIETVAVLLICVVSAYSVGLLGASMMNSVYK